MRPGDDLTADNTLAVTDSTFDDLVINSSGAVVVELWASWCGPCKQQAPIINELAGQFRGRVLVTTVDTMTNSAITARYGVLSIPTLLGFRDGEFQGKLVGAKPKKQLLEYFESLLPDA